jgi:GTP-binding protein
MRFVDEARIYVRSGRGGHGCVSFRREKFVAKGGPDGGDGGRGGHVVFEASSHIQSLLDFTYQRHCQARDGSHGRGKQQHGRDAPDLILKVPLGTVVKLTETGEILGDLTTEGQRLVVVRGGHGGKGNARFATSTRQVPRFSAPPGEGEERWLLLELKLLADVALVGLPNAGKSTLLARLSAARPKTAAYPFTTLVPYLGTLESLNGERIILADIPGLLEGAHRGVGLGLRFLKHIERTRLILYLLDLDPNLDGDPVEDYRVLREELGHYDGKLLERPGVIAMNKVDLKGAAERVGYVKDALAGEGKDSFAISALTGEGLECLAKALVKKVATIRLASGERDAFQEEGMASPPLG